MKRILLALSATLLFNDADTLAMSKIVAATSMKAALTTPRRHFHASRPVRGPVMAAALYWVTKCTCWAGVTIAGSAVVVGAVASATATGGASVGVPLAVAGGTSIGIGVGAVKIAASTALAATPTAAGTAAALTAGPAIVAVGVPLATAGIVGGVGTAIAVSPVAAATIVPAAKLGTVALATGSAGTGLGIAAGIESASCAAYAAGMAFPWF